MAQIRYYWQLDDTIDANSNRNMEDIQNNNTEAYLFVNYLLGISGQIIGYGEGGSEVAVIIKYDGGGEEPDGVGGTVAIVYIRTDSGGEHAGEDLYFLDEPNIQRQGVMATHVTVESPTATYTASTAGTPAEDAIERLIKINEGDEVTCESVAEELLARWGKEQVSISGKVPFTVTLRFKEVVRVFNDAADIDGKYILQRKEHDLSSFETRVTLGDIILSDSELLARIMEELE